MRLTVLLLSVALLTTRHSLCAQDPDTLNLVLLHGSGRIVLPPGPDWAPTAFALDPTSQTVSLTYQDHQHDITLTARLFPTDFPTSAACRDALMPTRLQALNHSGDLSSPTPTLMQGATGTPLATASFLLSTSGINPGSQQNLFAFAAASGTCAEFQLTHSDPRPDPPSLVPGTPHTRADAAPPTDPHIFDAALAALRFDPAYTPTAADYSDLGDLFYDSMRDFSSAATLYRRALDLLPNTPATLNQRRSLTNLLSTSYALTGDLQSAIQLNQQAIALDPAYPVYYYDLACADAERNQPLDAEAHLKQAFERRANALPDQPLPEPSHDPSLLELRHDKKFWKFVETLSRNDQ